MRAGLRVAAGLLLGAMIVANDCPPCAPEQSCSNNTIKSGERDANFGVQGQGTDRIAADEKWRNQSSEVALADGPALRVWHAFGSCAACSSRNHHIRYVDAQAAKSISPADQEARVNPRSFGAKGDNLTDDTSAFKEAITAAEVSGYRLIIPPGSYCIKAGPLVLAGSGQIVRGSGVKKTGLSTCGSTVGLLSITGNRNEVQGIQFTCGNPGVRKVNCVSLSSTSYENHISRNLITGGSVALAAAGQDNVVSFNRLLESYGTALLYVSGAGFFDRNKADMAWPGGVPKYASLASISAWQGNTVYRTGDIVHIDG